jgi:hypothetical protein
MSWFHSASEICIKKGQLRQGRGFDARERRGYLPSAAPNPLIASAHCFSRYQSV